MNNPFEEIDTRLSKIENQLSALESKQTPEPLAPQSKYLTRKETSIILDVSLVSLHKWERSKMLVPFRIGSRVRYLRSDVESLFKQRL